MKEKTPNAVTLETLWAAGIPVEDASLQASIRFAGKEETSLHKFKGAEFRQAPNGSILMKYKEKMGYVPSTNVKVAYYK